MIWCLTLLLPQPRCQTHNLLEKTVDSFRQVSRLRIVPESNVKTVSVGDLSSSIVHPREVYKDAVIASAASLIVAHNHPSGDPTPSAEDVAVTKRLIQSGEIMGIDLLDHIVLGDGTFVSLRVCIKSWRFGNNACVNERKPYSTDLTDQQWQHLEPLLPAVRRGGRPARYTRREIVNAILYVTRNGCAWRNLPHDLPPWSLVYTK